MRAASRSRKGAWIEMLMLRLVLMKTAGRSRKGAWIEINYRTYKQIPDAVAPARERGLKY